MSKANVFFIRQRFSNKACLFSLSTRACIAVGLIFLLFMTPVISAEQVSETEILSGADGSVEVEVAENTNPINTSSIDTSPIDKESVTSLIKTQRPTTSPPDVTASIVKVSAGLLLVIAAIFGSAWFFRRFGNFSPVANDALKVIGGLTIGQKEKIVLLQVGEEQVLVGVSPGSIQKIHVLEKPIPLTEASSHKMASFSDSLGEALGKWKNK